MKYSQNDAVTQTRDVKQSQQSGALLLHGNAIYLHLLQVNVQPHKSTPLFSGFPFILSLQKTDEQKTCQIDLERSSFNENSFYVV